jgi:hypothetical protein
MNNPDEINLIREAMEEKKNGLKRPNSDATPGPNYICHRCN